MIVERLLHGFADRGWMTIDLPDVDVVLDVRERLRQHLEETALPRLARLEDYHLHIDDDARHVEILFDLSRFYWQKGFGTSLIASHLPFFRELLGPDLHVQKYPYLRAVRPGTDTDAVLLHRDTYYGSSPYEIAVFIPFTDLSSESALRVVRGSHVEPDSAYPWTRSVSPDVTPGSPKHQLGFPYAPKTLEAAVVERAEPVPMRIGQALLFNLALVHGGATNAAGATRFSTDIRVVNSFAPIEWSHSVHQDYYTPLSSSVVSRLAQRYLAGRGD